MHRGQDGIFTITRRLVDGRGLTTVLSRPFPAMRGLEDGCVIAVPQRRARWLALHHQDTKLSAYYTVVRSSSACISRCT
jgi:hypothetical protein